MKEEYNYVYRETPDKKWRHSGGAGRQGGQNDINRGQANSTGSHTTKSNQILGYSLIRILDYSKAIV